MSGESAAETSPGWRRWVIGNRAGLLVALIILFVGAIRVHLRDMPLERDEGEYAYTGQLILQGVPPYKEACNMKLPGTYAAYALIMAVFGQTPSGIHLGLALVNAACVILVFLIGRHLLDDVAGVAAALVFALLSLSPSVLGLAAHATHFVTLAALAGTLLLLKACQPGGGSQERETDSPSGTQAGGSLLLPFATYATPQTARRQAPYRLWPISPRLLFASGVLFGLAFLMKQHGVFFGFFGASYLLGLWLEAWQAWRKRYRIPGSSFKVALAARIPAPRMSGTLKALGIFVPACLLPWLLTALVLWLAGVFPQYHLWTVTYANQYAAAVGLGNGLAVLRAGLSVPVGPNFVLWVLPWVGVLLMLWEERLLARYRFLLLSLLCFSFASVCVGFYFRGHYFITLLPVLALLSGIAVSRARQLLRPTIELLVAVPVLLLFTVGVVAAVIGDGRIWFSTPGEALRATYHANLFAEATKVADYIRINARKDARIAVMGSEPEIYFLSRRRAAASALYTYPLVEIQPLNEKMQRDMISEIEHARPEYVVYVKDRFSWLDKPDSPQAIFEWWKTNSASNLDLLMTFPIEEDVVGSTSSAAGAQPGTQAEINCFLLFKRKLSAR